MWALRKSLNLSYLFRNVERPKTTIGGNSIDFYAGLNIEKKLNPAMKTYVQVCKEKQLSDETNDVKGLLEWERNVLVEVDKKYDPDDDSEDEEKIARKKMLKAQAEAAKQQQEEAKAAAGPGLKKK